MRQKHHFLAGEGPIGAERLVHISDVFIGWQQITVRLWSSWPRSVNILRGCENGGGKPALLVQISTACSKKSRDHSVCIPARDVASSGNLSGHKLLPQVVEDAHWQPSLPREKLVFCSADVTALTK